MDIPHIEIEDDDEILVTTDGGDIGPEAAVSIAIFGIAEMVGHGVDVVSWLRATANDIEKGQRPIEGLN